MDRVSGACAGDGVHSVTIVITQTNQRIWLEGAEALLERREFGDFASPSSQL